MCTQKVMDVQGGQRNIPFSNNIYGQENSNNARDDRFGIY
jgi:hypothetical protein